MLNKRGQITVFMILGIVLLFSTALIFYIKGKVQIPEEELIPALEEIPDVLRPVRLYVEGCLSQITEDGISKAMEHGGLVDTSHLDIKPMDPTESDGIEMFPNSNITIPYWYYMKSKNTCRSGCMFSTAKPPLCKQGRIGCFNTGYNSIEEQIEKYIESELEGCIRNFEDLTDKGYKIKKLGNATAKVNIRQEDATAILHYPLEVEKAGTTSKINDYYATERTRLAWIYELAHNLWNYTSTNCLLEDNTLNYLSFYQGLDPTDLPPYFETSVAKRDVSWPLYTVKEKIRKITTQMTRLIKIYNTSSFTAWPTTNFSGEYASTVQGLYGQFVYYPFDEYEDIEVTFQYNPWWEPYFDVMTEGGLIKPSFAFDSSGFGWWDKIIGKIKPRDYEIFYKYSYPVLIELKYEDEFGNPHVFRFAEEVNIRSNRCYKSNKTISTLPSGEGGSLLCDINTWTGNNKTISVKDKYNDSAIEGAEVIYYAGEECNLGFTDDKGELKTRMPDAYGYFLKVKKDGYLEKLAHETDIGFPIEIELIPILRKNVTFMAFNTTILEKIRTARTRSEAMQWIKNSSEPLTLDDTLMVQIERVADNYKDGKLSHFMAYDNGTLSPDYIDIAPGKYDIQVRLYLRKNVTLPFEYDRVCVEKGVGGDCLKTPVSDTCSPRGDSLEDFEESDCYKEGYTCESIAKALKRSSGAVSAFQVARCTVGSYAAYLGCATIIGCTITINEIAECTARNCDVNEEVVYKEQNLTIFPNGGVILSNETRLVDWRDYDHLKDTDEIVIYLFRQDIPTRHHHMNDLNIFEDDWSKRYRKYIEPELK